MASKRRGLLDDYDLFVFDWDGTLNRMRFLLGANEGMKRALHIWNEDSSIKDFRRVNHDLKRRLKSIEGRNDAMTLLFDVFMALGRPKLHNDSLKMMERIRKAGKKTAIFSNGGSYRLVKELQSLGLVGYFDMIVSARELNAVKPNPTGLKFILSTLKVKPDRCLYMGDMIDDILAAKLSLIHISEPTRP